ncbi:unnamed protein product [Hymenolepis diminuta]|uniref:Uncharacterized protein n=1 Tax=Hymenolepis diminuta TaxID=6216 RepID=A0A564YT58_HYMDI|nr:unnamed protein product [Hymenolepis diminuta]
MSKRVHRFPLFSITDSLHIKRHICAQDLAWPYPSDSYKATLVFPDNTHWSVRTPTRPVHLLSSSTRCFLYLSPFISLSLSVTRFKLVSTLGVLLHNCCWLLLKQLRIGDCYCCCYLLATNRWLLSNSNKFF